MYNFTEHNYYYPPEWPKSLAEFVEKLPLDGMKVAVVSSLPTWHERVERLIAEAPRHGKKLSVLAEKEVRRGDVSFGMTVLSIER